MATAAEAKKRIVSRTRNDLPEDVRSQMIELCNHRLASAIDLATQVKQAHWNVKGPSFWGLHKLFDEIAAATQVYVDSIAERVAQLGGQVEGTMKFVQERTTLAEYPATIKEGTEHVKALSAALATFGRCAREAIDLADDAEDKDTADIFTEVSRGTDQWLWFVEAHTQAAH